MPPDEARAFRAGAGMTNPDTLEPWTIDVTDEDMADAALLASPDGMGGIWWKPSTLDDIYSLPPRVLRLLSAYRAGLSHAASKEAPPTKSGTIGDKRLG